MKLRLTSFAKAELFRVHDYHERKAPDLGDRFLDEAQSAFSSIKDYPRAWTRLEGNIYRVFWRGLVSEARRKQ